MQQGGESIPNAPDAVPFLAELILRLYLQGIDLMNYSLHVWCTIYVYNTILIHVHV